MPRERIVYVCQVCGRRAAKPVGRCPQCGEWNTYVAQVETPQPRTKGRRVVRRAPRRLRDIPATEEARWPVPIGEFARVLGGGIMPASLVLLGGDPGIGKSTLLLQAGLEVARERPVLYVSGEESEAQIRMRAQRLWRGEDAAARPFPENFYLLSETDLEAVLAAVEQVHPQVLIVDSIQTVYLPDLEGVPGGVTQVREAALRFQMLAKEQGMAVFLIGHVTKEGVLAGPKLLEHLVDTVLYLEGDRFQAYRLLRAVKNRFGPTAEVGVFEMTDRGMVEVPNPSEVFLAGRVVDAPGSAITVTMEGTRPLLVEIQGLTSPTPFGQPRRTAIGVDAYRLLLVLAVLTRRVGLRLGDQDVFANVVGGLRLQEPAADLALAAAIASSFRDKPVRADAVLIGEVGLSGELREVSHLEARVREAAQFGFRLAIVPRILVRRKPKWPQGIEVRQARTLRQALQWALSSAS